MLMKGDKLSLTSIERYKANSCPIQQHSSSQQRDGLQWSGHQQDLDVHPYTIVYGKRGAIVYKSVKAHCLGWFQRNQ